MEDRIERHRVSAEHDLLLAPVHLRDACRLAGEELRREVAEGCDERRLHQFDLPEQMPFAGLDLLRQRIAVAGRPALYDICHIDIVPRHPDPLEQLAEQLPGGAHERDALLVLVEARRFADEHQLRCRRARAEDDLRPRLGERTLLAARDNVAVGDQREISRSCHNRRHNSHRHRRRAVRRCRALRMRC